MQLSCGNINKKLKHGNLNVYCVAVLLSPTMKRYNMPRGTRKAYPSCDLLVDLSNSWNQGC